jgi:hypothetical protein
VAALVAIAVFGRRWPGAMRAIPFLFAPFAAYLAVNAVETGYALPAGAAAKSLLAGDLSAARATEVLWENVLRIAGSFSIQGPPLLLPLGLGCAAAALFRPRSGARGVAAFLLGATAIVLGNRFAAWHHGRYLVPLLPVAMLCAAPVLARSIGQRWVRVVVAAWLLANAAMLPAALGTYADDVSDIANQQVAAGRFLARATPPDARIGVMDAGAILYLSDRRGIDLVGLGTPGLAPDFLDGTGARLAALARLPRERRPTHYAVYPSFFRGFKPVFGAELARFELERLHIAGDPLLVVYEAAPDRFAEAGRALATDAGSACDVVDFADRVSERAHATEFAALGTVAIPSGPRGARVARSTRVIQSASTRLDCPGAEDTTLRVTLAATEAAEIAVEVDGRPADAARLGGGWHERVIPLQAGGARVSIVARPHVALDRVALETAR